MTIKEELQYQQENADWRKEFEYRANTGYYYIHEAQWNEDFRRFLVNMGVPDQYVDKVAALAWSLGHSSGYYEILNFGYDLIEIF